MQLVSSLFSLLFLGCCFSTLKYKALFIWGQYQLLFFLLPAACWFLGHSIYCSVWLSLSSPPWLIILGWLWCPCVWPMVDFKSINWLHHTDFRLHPYHFSPPAHAEPRPCCHGDLLLVNIFSLTILLSNCNFHDFYFTGSLISFKSPFPSLLCIILSLQSFDCNTSFLTFLNTRIHHFLWVVTLIIMPCNMA